MGAGIGVAMMRAPAGDNCNSSMGVNEGAEAQDNQRSAMAEGGIT